MTKVQPQMVAHSLEAPVSRHLPLPCVAVAGEAKSGKSSLINALLGAPALPTGLTDHVPLPVLVSYASKPSLVLERSDRRRVATDWIGRRASPSTTSAVCGSGSQTIC